MCRRECPQHTGKCDKVCAVYLFEPLAGNYFGEVKPKILLAVQLECEDYNIK